MRTYEEDTRYSGGGFHTEGRLPAAAASCILGARKEFLEYVAMGGLTGFRTKIGAVLDYCADQLVWDLCRDQDATHAATGGPFGARNTTSKKIAEMVAVCRSQVQDIGTKDSDSNVGTALSPVLLSSCPFMQFHTWGFLSWLSSVQIVVILALNHRSD
jgi:hypothetical protein